MIDQHPKMIEYAERVAEVAGAETVVKDRIAAKMAEHAANLDEWTAETSGLPVDAERPSRPEPPDLTEDDRALAQLRRAREQLREWKDDLLIEIRPEIEQQARSLMADVMERKAGPVQELLALLDEANTILHEVADVRRAVDSSDPNRTPLGKARLSARTVQRLSLAELLDADESVLDLLPLVRKDDSQPTAVTVERQSIGGLTGPGFGERPPMTPLRRTNAVEI